MLLVLYILKIKGTKTIPDFVQIRDEEMTLLAYFRLSQQEVGLKKNNLLSEKEGIMELLEKIPYGKIHKYYTTDE